MNDRGDSGCRRYPAERISVFDVFKIGVGPSSSHTTGPWRAALDFLERVSGLSRDVAGDVNISHIGVSLYGSLAKTGSGHGTDRAVILGLSGYDPGTVDVQTVRGLGATMKGMSELRLFGGETVPFSYDRDIAFHRDEILPYHPNGVTFTADFDDGTAIAHTYFSIGGGFIVREGAESEASTAVELPYPVDSAGDLLVHTDREGVTISEIVRRNENSWRPAERTRRGIREIVDEMLDCVFRGITTEEVLPGGLGVHRRAASVASKLLSGTPPSNSRELLPAVRRSYIDRASGVATDGGFELITRWVSCFALAVNEENAAFGRVVTAPTNGAAGVVPAVLLYYLCFDESQPTAGSSDMYDRAEQFLLTAAEIGSIFKKGATISAAMGGCQAEIGVSSAMAAGALAEVKGGTATVALQAAEIAMEHHLGLTCDPVGGLVQIPCIERNTMGALKAIAAANLALSADPGTARVSLDDVVKTMWDTACDMNAKYKETSEGGLASNIPINVIEC